MNYALEQYYKTRMIKVESRIEELEEKLTDLNEELEQLKADYQNELDLEMNADDSEHAKAYEADIRRGL